MSLCRAPNDVLQHIAFLTADPDASSPRAILALLLTSRTLYHALNASDSPHLYAAVFRLKHGPAPKLLLRTVTDSALAAELRRRCLALRRCRRRDVSVDGLRQDLTTLLRMVLTRRDTETFADVGFSAYILLVARVFLHDGEAQNPACDADSCRALRKVVIWLLCLGLSRDDILAQSIETHSQLVGLLRPFVSSFPPDARNSTPAPTPSAPQAVGGLTVLPVAEVDNETRMELMCSTPPRASFYDPSEKLPSASYAAVVLIFALKEAVPLQIPYHLPLTRAAAIAANRAGPTAEDYAAFQQAVTVLFSDVRNADPSPPLLTASADIWVARLFPGADLLAGQDADQRALCDPGSLAGVWEGSIMISSCGLPESSEPSDFLCRTPMQCEFTEIEDEALSPGLNQREGATPTRSAAFESNSDSGAPGENPSGSGARVAIAIVGQTSPEHEEAWGSDGFTFAGRAHEDGGVVFTRRPKHAANDTESEDGTETWVFSGLLCYGAALVGTFRSSLADDACGVHGVFSLRKRPAAAPAADSESEVTDSQS
uniref:F-box domain-containing protein n=1 Tax=Mycena chlorophos TaxID=658473 RepID=A0ABQ0L021_MYCCL|nr:predicted protein [Mycena chlorophos]